MVATAHLTICVGQQDTAWRWRSYVEKRASVREVPPHKKTVSLSNFVQSAVSCLAQIVF
jgi:hypothetical protein